MTVFADRIRKKKFCDAFEISRIPEKLKFGGGVN